MKKLLSITLIVIFGVALIAPHFVGKHIEPRLYKLVEKASKKTGYPMRISDYQKRWFNSVAIIELLPKRSANSSTNLEPPILTLTHKLQHGPLLWKAGGLGLGLVDSTFNIDLPKDIQQELDKYNPEKRPLATLTTRTSLTGPTTLWFALEAFSMKESTKGEPDSMLELKPGKGTFTFYPEGRLVGSSAFGGIDYSSAGLPPSLSISGLSLTFDQRLIDGEFLSPNALYSGDAAFTVNQISAKEMQSKQSVNINQLSLTLIVDIGDELTNTQFNLNINAIEAQQIKLTNIINDISLENFDTPFLKTVNQAAQKSDGLPSKHSTQKMEALLPQLIEKQPSIKINQLSMVTAEGEIDSHFNLTIDKNKYEPGNPKSISLALLANAKGHAPEAFFTQLGLTRIIDSLIDQGLLMRENNQLKFELDLKDGQASLNGQQMPLNIF